MHNERLFGLFTGKFCFSQNASAFKDVRFPFNLCVSILFVKFHLSCRHHFVQHSAGSHWQRKTRLRTFQQNNGPCKRSCKNVNFPVHSADSCNPHRKHCCTSWKKLWFYRRGNKKRSSAGFKTYRRNLTAFNFN